MEIKRFSVKAYIPLGVLVFIAMFAAISITYGVGGGLMQGMHYFMGFFLCQFAMLKIFHLKKFVEGFGRYDLVAMNYLFYAYLYPFIELSLGLAYLSFVFLKATYLITILIGAIGSIGVVKALKKGLDLRCACMGTVLDVPLSTVTLTEDIGMGFMAFFMFIQ